MREDVPAGMTGPRPVGPPKLLFLLFFFNSFFQKVEQTLSHTSKQKLRETARAEY
jgi:hypothetical protein